MFEDVKWGISYSPSWDRTGMPESGYSKKDAALKEFFDAIDDDIDYVALYYNNGTRWEKREVYKNGMPKPKRPNNPSTLTIPDGTKIIDKVKLKTKVVELYIPASVEEIAPAALYGAYNLKKVVFADNSNLKKIGNQAFAYCKDLTSINLPSSLEEIEYYAFYNCRSLESINLPNNIKKLGSSIFNVTGITSIVVPPYAELDRTFYECKNIESVILSEGLETIGHDAFFSCDNLKSVKLPNSLKKIDGQAFAFCDNLKTISILGNTTKIASDAFEGCPNASLIYYGSRQDLKNNLFFPERTYSHNICLPQNIVYKTEDQNLESILAESFEKTIKSLKREGLFENVKSFDLSLKNNRLNIKLNENEDKSAYRWGVNYEHTFEDISDELADDPNYIPEPDELFKTEDEAYDACCNFMDREPTSFCEIVHLDENNEWQAEDDYGNVLY